MFLIAQCNNFFRFWQLFQDLINPMVEGRMATDDEIQAHYNERQVIQKFGSMQDMLITQVCNRIFRKPLADYNYNRPLSAYYERSFMDLDMQGILN